MTLYGDYASIAATTAGVTGTISVPQGAQLIGLNASMATADGGIISAIEITAPNFPQPLRFTFPHGFGSVATNMFGLAVAHTPLIKLNLRMTGGNTVTVKVTTTANETVVIGLMWTAP